MNIKIYLHNIEYHYEDGMTREMTHEDVEHIKTRIEKGFYNGELSTGIRQYYGRWKIKKEDKNE